jgi:hypothetical protein
MKNKNKRKLVPVATIPKSLFAQLTELRRVSRPSDRVEAAYVQKIETAKKGKQQ